VALRFVSTGIRIPGGIPLASVALVFGFLIANPAAGNTDVTVREIHARHSDAVARLQGFKVATHFTGIPLSQGDFYQKAMGARLEEMRNSQELQDAFRGAMQRNGFEVGDGFNGIKRFVEDRIAENAQVTARREAVNTRHEFVLGDIRQIKAYLSAEESKLAESGRDYRLLQYGLHHEKVSSLPQRWTCLDERQPRGVTIVWAKTRLVLDGMVPPGFDHSSVSCRFPSELSDIWMSPADVQSFGVFETADGIIQVVGIESDQSNLLLAAYDTASESGFPVWTCRCTRLGASGNMAVASAQIDEAAMKSLVRRVQIVREEGSTTDCRVGDLAPRLVTTFSDQKTVDGIGVYPCTATHLVVGSVKKDDQTHSLSAASRYRLVVSDFEHIDDVQAIVIEEGFNFLDKDTNVSIIVGQKHSDQIRGLSFVRKRSVLLGLNLAFLAVLAILAFSRLRSQKKA